MNIVSLSFIFLNESLMMFLYKFIFFLFSVSPIDNTKPVIVTHIERYHNSEYCLYYGKGCLDIDIVATPTSSDFVLIDTCGKWQIGDTIRLSK